MRTTKPISTISFNTPDFLALKLDELVRGGKLSFWCFVCHQPEDDEGGTKEHEHVYIEPSKLLQTDDIREALKEFDPDNPSKPRGCLPFRISAHFGDWYLYALHDKRYLASKGQSRHFHYVHDEIITSDTDNLLYLSRSIDLLALSPYSDMQDAISQGLTFDEYFKRGTIPLMQIRAFQEAWGLLTGSYTNRNGRDGHAMDSGE